MASPFKLREAKESDFPFIYATWLKGLRFGNDVFGTIEQHSYFRNYHKVIETILHRPSVVIPVACLIEDPNTILGYALREDGMLHYIHVKSAFRRFGIARALSPPEISRVTHTTKMGWAILKEKFPNAIYDPFL